MATYYNKTRAPVTVSLRDGSSTMVPPRQKLVLTAAQDGSGQIHACVRKGLLVKLREPAPAVGEEAAEEAADGVEAPSMSWKKDELIDHAEEVGIEVASGMTKAEILGAIEGA